MTNKDLNLALDQHLIPTDQPTKPSVHQQNTNTGTYRSNAEPMTNPHATQDRSPKSRNPASNYFSPDHLSQDHTASTHPDQSFHKGQKNFYKWLPTSWLRATKQQVFLWLSVVLVSINLLFLLLAGLWLSSQDFKQQDNVALAHTPNKAVTTKLATVNQKLERVQQQLDQLSITLSEQQQLIAKSSHNIDQQLQAFNAKQNQFALALQPVKPTTEPKPSQKKAAPSPKPTNNWHVNIGTFSSKDAALRLKKQLLVLGHSVQINDTQINDKQAYRVQLPGFKDREAAEQVATKIMDQTKLNGLWAWKDG